MEQHLLLRGGECRLGEQLDHAGRGVQEQGLVEIRHSESCRISAAQVQPCEEGQQGPAQGDGNIGEVHGGLLAGTGALATAILGFASRIAGRSIVVARALEGHAEGLAGEVERRDGVQVELVGDAQQLRRQVAEEHLVDSERQGPRGQLHQDQVGGAARGAGEHGAVGGGRVGHRGGRERV